MRISHTGKWIFFSNPKCGSESVRAMLDRHAEPAFATDQEPAGALHPHTLPRDLRAWMETVGLDFASYYRWTTVRNPWARLVSLFEFKRRRHIPGDLVPQDFRAWILDNVARGLAESQHLAWVYGTYPLARFAGDANGSLLVDAVVRLERAAVELPPVLARCGLPRLRLPRRNLGKHADYRRYYDSKTREAVGNLYRDDVARFGYTFDNG